MGKLQRRPLLLLFSVLSAGLILATLLVVLVLHQGTLLGWYHQWRGNQMLTQRQYGAALRQFLAAADAAPGDPAPLTQVAAIHMQFGRLAQAEADYQRALQREPGRPDALLGLARLKIIGGDYSAAVTDLQSIIARSPQYTDALAELADAYALRGDLDASATEWQRVLSSRSISPALRQRGQYRAGLAHLAGDPDAALRYLQAASTRKEEGVSSADLGSALSAGESAVRRRTFSDADPTATAQVAASIGYTYLRADLLVAAREQLERAVSLDPSYSDALSYLGYVYFLHGEIEKATATLSRAATISPESSLARYMSAVVLRSRGGLSQAAALLEEAVQEDSGDAALLVELARTLTAQGDYVGASECYERAVALNPTDGRLLLDAASFYVTHVFRVDLALGHARQSVQLMPRSAKAQDALGWSLHLNHDDEGAIIALRRANEFDSALPEPFYHMAVIYERQGDKAEAVDAYRRVLALDAGDLADRADAALRDLQ